MHEWALAEGVISTAVGVAEDNDANEIVEIKIKVGSLQKVDREAFEFALKEISKDTIAEKSEKNVITEDAVLKCRACGEVWKYSDTEKDLPEDEIESIHFVPDLAHAYIRCPNCDSPDFEVIEGRGVWIDSVELKK